MNEYQTLSHTKWECKYHVVFIPKYRRKVLYGRVRQELGEVFRELARQKESRTLEGLSMPAVSVILNYNLNRFSMSLNRCISYGHRQCSFTVRSS